MRPRSAAVVVAACALVAACSGGSKPKTLPTLLPTPSATPASVAVPTAATVHDAFGAAAFVRFYYDQLNRAYGSADPTPIVDLADPSCGTCKNYVAAIRDLASRGERMRGEAVKVTSAEAPPEANGLVAVDVFLAAPVRALIDGKGEVVQRLTAGPPKHKTVYLKHVATGWLVRAVKDAA